VAHVFQEEKRDFYGIEQLWGDAEEIVFKGK
jgi:ribosomal silencing factor RsfS